MDAVKETVLVWLEWPVDCFRMDAESLKALKALVPAGTRVVRVRTEAAFLKALPQATRAIVWHFKPDWFALAPRLKLLATPGAGRELVPKEGPKGVTIHFGGYHGAIISETVVGFILAWAHGFFRPELKIEGPWRDSWPRSLLGGVCSLVAGTHAVIAGYGRIGRAIGAKLESLGVRVSGFSRANISDLPSVMKTADWFILALPSDTGTDGFLNSSRLKKLPRRCVVINIGRGNAVDEPALLDALRSGRLAGAYLDVFSAEPGPIAHVASASHGARDILGTPAKDLPPNLVRTPHSCAFCAQYLELCFRELKAEGLLGGRG